MYDVLSRRSRRERSVGVREGEKRQPDAEVGPHSGGAPSMPSQRWYVQRLEVALCIIAM